MYITSNDSCASESSKNSKRFFQLQVGLQNAMEIPSMLLNTNASCAGISSRLAVDVSIVRHGHVYDSHVSRFSVDVMYSVMRDQSVDRFIQ